MPLSQGFGGEGDAIISAPLYTSSSPLRFGFLLCFRSESWIKDLEVWRDANRSDNVKAMGLFLSLLEKLGRAIIGPRARESI